MRAEASFSNSLARAVSVSVTAGAPLSDGDLSRSGVSSAAFTAYAFARLIPFVRPELIEISTGDHRGGRPGHSLLMLRVEFGRVDLARCLDLVL